MYVVLNSQWFNNIKFQAYGCHFYGTHQDGNKSGYRVINY